MVGSSGGKREVIVKHYCERGIPRANNEIDTAFEREIKAWAEVNVEASEGREVAAKNCKEGFPERGEAKE